MAPIRRCCRLCGMADPLSAGNPRRPRSLRNSRKCMPRSRGCRRPHPRLWFVGRRLFARYEAATVEEDSGKSGLRNSHLSQQMARNERFIDQFEASHPIVRVVRLRAAMIVTSVNRSHRPLRALGPPPLWEESSSPPLPRVHTYVWCRTWVHDRYKSSMNTTLRTPFARLCHWFSGWTVQHRGEPFTSSLVIQTFDARGMYDISEPVLQFHLPNSAAWALFLGFGIGSTLHWIARSSIRPEPRRNSGAMSQYSAAAHIGGLARRTLTGDSTKSKSRKDPDLFPNRLRRSSSDFTDCQAALVGPADGSAGETRPSRVVCSPGRGNHSLDSLPPVVPTDGYDHATAGAGER